LSCSGSGSSSCAKDLGRKSVAEDSHLYFDDRAGRIEAPLVEHEDEPEHEHDKSFSR
jgi:hypothetical protein